MKTQPHLLFLALVSSWLLSVLPAAAQQEQQPPQPVAVTILRASGQRQLGFIKQTNENGILFSTTETGQGEPVAHSDLRAVIFNNEGDIMGQARQEYSRSRWEEAEKLFRAVADQYDFLFGISREQMGNFASEARFYQIDSLRRLGRYSEMAAAMDTKTGSTLEKTVAEVHLPAIKLFKLWIALAGEKWEELEAGLKEYEEAPTPEVEKHLESPSFKPDAPGTLVQLAYMRGRLNESKEEKEKALRDYYRAITLDYGSDRILTTRAMEAALALQAAEEDLEGNYPKETEIHALATVYKNVFNKGEISATLLEFTRPPDMPEAVRQQMEARAAEEAARKEAAAAEAAAAAPAPAPAAKAPAEEKKPAEKKK